MDPLDTIRQLIGGLTTLTAEELLDQRTQAQANCEAARERRVALGPKAAAAEETGQTRMAACQPTPSPRGRDAARGRRTPRPPRLPRTPDESSPGEAGRNPPDSPRCKPRARPYFHRAFHT